MDSSEEGSGLMNKYACIVHTGHIDRDGYGRIFRRGEKILAHREAWSLVNGPIPEGLVIDHLCWNRACVNVLHLRLLSADENRKRQRAAESDMCAKGHLYDEKNTYIRPDTGRRQCRACGLMRVIKYSKKKSNPASSQSPQPTLNNTHGGY